MRVSVDFERPSLRFGLTGTKPSCWRSGCPVSRRPRRSWTGASMRAVSLSATDEGSSRRCRGDQPSSSAGELPPTPRRRRTLASGIGRVPRIGPGIVRGAARAPAQQFCSISSRPTHDRQHEGAPMSTPSRPLVVRRRCPVVVKAVDSGPLQVKGPVRLVEHDGISYDVPSRRAMFLCRCGQSGNKPFCDGSHERTEFTAVDRAAVDADAAADSRAPGGA